MAIPILSDVGIQGGLTIDGGFSFQQQTTSTLIHSSGAFGVDFNTGANYYICNAASGTHNHSISFANISSNVGQSGTIIINNPSDVSSLTWASPALPGTAYTPGGSAITFNLTASKIAVMTYFIASSTKVLINYVGNFSSYPQ